MNENQQTQAVKKVFPLALLLLAAHVVVNFRRLPGLVKGISALSGGGPLGYVQYGGMLGIVQYLSYAVPLLTPLLMTVLVAVGVFQNRNTAKPVGALCTITGVCFLLNASLTLYGYLRIVQIDFYTLFPQLGGPGALLAYGIGMLQIGSRLRKETLRPRFKSYGLLSWYLFLALLIFVIVPGFMDMTITLGVGSMLSNLLLMAAGFFLPATLLEGGANARGVSMVSGVVTVCLAVLIFTSSGQIGYSSYADSHAMPEVTTVTCPVCHKKYTDNGNKKSIQRSNMCSSCKISFEATKDALGW